MMDKRRQKIIFYLLFPAMLLLLMFSLLFYTNVLQKITEMYLENILDAEIDIAVMETNYFSHLKLNNISVRFPHSVNPKARMIAKNAELNFNLTDLLKKEFTINSFLIDSLYCFIDKDTAGRYSPEIINRMIAQDSTASASNFRINFGSAQLKRGKIVYNDLQNSLNTEVNGVTLELISDLSESINFHFQTDSVNGRYQDATINVKNGSFSGNFHKEILAFDAFALLLPDMQLKGTASLTFRQQATDVRSEFVTSGNPEKLNLELKKLFPGVLPDLSGESTILTEICGTTNRPEVEITYLSQSLALNDFEFSDVNMNMIWKDNTVNVTELRCGMYGGGIMGSAVIGTMDEMNLSFHDIEISDLMKTAYGKKTLLQGKLSGSVKSKGKLNAFDDLNLTADMTLNKFKHNSNTIDDLLAKLVLQNGRSHVSIALGQSGLDADLSLIDDRLDGTYSGDIVEIFPFAQLFGIAQLEGDVNFNGIISGHVSNPQVSANLFGAGIKFKGFPIDSLLGSVTYSAKGFVFEDIRFSGSDDADDSKSTFLSRADILGTMRYKGTADGPLNDIRSNVEIQFFEPGYKIKSFERGFLTASVNNRHIHLDSLILENDSLALKSSGSFFLDTNIGHFSLSAETMDESQSSSAENHQLDVNFDLSEPNDYNIHFSARKFPIEHFRTMIVEISEIHGLLDADITLNGNLRDPELDGIVKIVHPQYNAAIADSIIADISFSGDLFSFNSLEVVAGSERARFEGASEIERGAADFRLFTKNAFGRAVSDGFDIQILNPFLPDRLKIAGTASFNLHYSVDTGFPKILGNLDLKNAGIRSASDFPLVQNINGSIAFEDSLHFIPKFSGIVDEKTIMIQGMMKSNDIDLELFYNEIALLYCSGYLNRDSVDVVMELRQLDLNLIQNFIPKVSFTSGKLDGKITITDSLTSPRINGYLSAHKLSLRMPEYGFNAAEGKMKIFFEDQNVRIDTVSCNINDGKLFAFGTLEHEGVHLKKAIMDAQITGVKYRYSEIGSFLLKNAFLRYEKIDDAADFSGIIRFDEARLLLNFRPQSLLPFTRNVSRPKSQMPETLRSTRLNLQVKESDKLWIDNNLARLRLEADVTVLGNPENIKIAGKVNCKEGYLLYLDRKFQVKQGVVDFIDPDRLNPEITLQAVASLKAYQTLEKQEYDITLSINGPLEHAVVDLASEPVLEKPDIFALLTVGATRKSLTDINPTGRKISANEILRERMTAISSDKISHYAGKKVGNLLGLERMTIEGNLFKINRSSGPQLIASKKISSRLKLTYMTSVGEMNEQGMRLDYRLSKYLSMQGQTDQKGRSGIDLKYGLKFK